MEITHEIEYRTGRVYAFIRANGNIIDSISFDINEDPKIMAIDIQSKIDMVKRGTQAAEAVKALLA